VRIAKHAEWRWLHITRCDSTSSLFGIGKRTVFKVLKGSPENFRDLSTLADCDTDKSIDAASNIVCRLYDQKGKLKEDHVDLNKLRVRLATLRELVKCYIKQD
jgi:hypothetical protein